MKKAKYLLLISFIVSILSVENLYEGSTPEIPIEPYNEVPDIA